MAVRMVVTDLDGTLLGSERRLSAADHATLVELGARGIVRVIATGRSLFSALKVLTPEMPFDFLVHASGAGIARWPDRRPLRAISMARESALTLATELIARRLDFMLHRALPDNHHFYAHRALPENADFERRLELFAAFGSALELPLRIEQLMTQAVVIQPAAQPSQYESLRGALPEFQVIRATSPLDGESTWIEIFPRGVGKASACEWLRAELGHTPGAVVAVGNDYNDLELLDWADHAFVVGNAPADLQARYRAVASNDQSGFSEAVRLALAAHSITQG